MPNKKLLAPLFVIAGACLLASCSTSTVVARPDWSGDKIIDVDNIKDNQMKAIYDAVKALGDTNSNVLNEVLYKIAVKQVGSFDKLEKYRFDNTSIKNDDADLKAFINDSSHNKLYKPTSTKLAYKKDGNVITRDLTDDEKITASRKLIQKQYDEVIENVYEAFYNEIKGGTYSKNNLFDEEKYYQNIRKNMYITSPLNCFNKWTKDAVIEAKPYKEDGKEVTWKKHVNKILHIINEDTGTYWKGTDGIELYKDYIETKLIKDVYRNFLIRSYVKDQRSSNVARSYARKVNMITVPHGSTTEQVNVLMYTFATDNIIKAGSHTFKDVEKAMNGIVNDGDYAKELLVAAKFTPNTGTGTEQIVWPLHDKDGSESGTSSLVYKGTKLGDLVEKYQKIYDLKMNNGMLEKTLKANPDQTAYNDLTNTGAYTIGQGLAIKEREIQLTSYTKYGWYLKNGGLTDLNATIRDRLFNIATSGIIDKAEKKKENSYEIGDYAVYLNGKAYLTGKSSSTKADEKLIVLDDGSNYHIIEIEEAISTSKMSTDTDNENSYLKTKAGEGEENKFESTDAMNNIFNDVVKITASGDTYKKSANQYYLMISNILFYDQSVYDYFKSQYPDLFK